MMITGWGGYNHVGYAQKVGSWVHPISIDLRSTVNMILITPTWNKKNVLQLQVKQNYCVSYIQCFIHIVER